MVNRPLRWLGRNSRRVFITVAGFTLLIVGVILIPLPGPGWLIVFAGLAVLAREYAWARKTLDEMKKRSQQARAKVRRKKKKTP